MNNRTLPLRKAGLVCVLLSVLTCAWAQAQTRTITGTVSDTSGETVIGAYVVNKATNTGAVTDASGRYELKGVSDATVLLISSLGYADKEVSVGARSVVDVVLEIDVNTLDDVLVIGYGSVRKADMTGSAAAINSDDFKIGSNLSAEQLMRGSIPGVSISQNSGKPGGTFTVRVRGGTSISASNEPLYVIDGVPISTASSVISRSVGADHFDEEGVDPLSNLSPEDIESINVLKDASATAIYGSRGANGVIMITTKRGKTGKAVIEYSANAAVSSAASRLEVLTGDEYRSIVKSLGFTLDDKGDNADWQSRIFRTAFSQSHHLALSGGSENTFYRASIGYSDQDGIVKSSGMTNLNSRISITHTQFDGKLKIDFTMSFNQQDNDQAPISNTVGSEMGSCMLYEAYVFNPTYPVYDSNGDYYDVPAYRVNPVSFTDELTDERRTQKFSGVLSASYNFLKPLTFKVNAGYNTNTTNRNSYISKNNLLGNGYNGFVSTQRFSDWSKLFETYLNYNQTFGKHSIDAMAGYSYQYFFEEGLSQSASGFLSDEFKWYSIQAANKIDTPYSFAQSNTLISFFGRVNYGYDNRYLLTATLRNDGSSRFGADHKWGLFPSVAFAWKINNEDFFNVGAVSDLKLRGSWGITGSQEIGNYNSLSTLSASTNAYLIGGQKVNIVMPTQYSNPDLKWEETSQLNFGLDYGFLDGRISGSLDWYRKVTSDLLLSIAVPSPSYITTQTANVGSVKNSGVEFSINAELLRTKDFSWTANANVSHNENVVLSLKNDKYVGDDMLAAPCQGQGLSGQYAQLITPGHPLGTFYGYRYTGIDSDGMETYANNGEKEVIGCAQPDLTYGFGTNLSYKRWSLSMNFHGTVGNDVYNCTSNNLAYLANLPGRNVLREAVSSGVSINQPKTFSSRWIEDASFLRLDNITLAYNFDVRKTFISSARVYLTAQNVFVLTGYSGLDPEVNSQTSGTGISPIGIDYLSYPRARTFSIGINLSF